MCQTLWMNKVNKENYSHPHKADTLAGETENNGYKLEISDRMLCYEEN